MSVPFTVVIPARLGARRLPQKPLLDLGGRPLVVRVWERAMAAGAQRVVVATDHEDVVAAVTAAGGEALLTAPEHGSGSERVAEVVERLELADDALVVNLQGDEPFMPAAVIRQLAEALAARPELGMATVATPIETTDELFDPHVVKVVLDARGHALYFSRAPIPWDRDAFAHTPPRRLPEGCWRHIGLYAYRAGFLARYVRWPAAPMERSESLEQLRVLHHGEPILVVPACEAPGPGIDTPADLERARAHWCL